MKQGGYGTGATPACALMTGTAFFWLAVRAIGAPPKQERGYVKAGMKAAYRTRTVSALLLGLPFLI